MKVKIQNFGRVTSADIRLDGITVIAGSNGSGKSTISRVLMTWLSYLRQIDYRIEQERIRSIRDAVIKIMAAADLPVYYFKQLRNSRKLLERSFWQNRNEIVDLIASSVRVSGIYNHDDTRVDLKGRVNGVYDSICAAAYKILDTPDELYEFFVANMFFQRAFDGQVGSFFDRKAESLVKIEMDGGNSRSATFAQGKCSILEDIRGNHVIPTFYIEPQHMIDSYIDRLASNDFYSRAPDNRFSCGEEFGWVRILYTNPDIESWSLERSQQQEELNKELDKIVTVIHGQIEKEDRNIRFKDQDSGDMISIRNVASGVKSMAVLIRGLRNGMIGPGSMLIIDEPETNLHPEWQVKFAEFLILLNAKFGIRSLLNTHSPYFLKAIKVYADLLGIQDKCSYYMMKPDESGLRYGTDDVSETIEQVFEMMSLPYAKLIYGADYGGHMEQSK